MGIVNLGRDLTISEMQKEAWENSEAKGFHKKDYEIPHVEYVVATKLMLAVSELAEALEEQRDFKPTVYFDKETGKPEGIGIELADVVIRCGDLAQMLGVNLSEAVTTKMKFNATRPHLHGRKTL